MPVTSAELTGFLKQDRRLLIMPVSTETEIDNTFFKAVVRTQTSAVTINIPTCASTNIPVGFWFEIDQAGAGKVTVSGRTGVSINVPSSSSAQTNAVGAKVTLYKVDQDTWDIRGNVSSKQYTNP
jgi:hypothetical protein